MEERKVKVKVARRFDEESYNTLCELVKSAARNGWWDLAADLKEVREKARVKVVESRTDDIIRKVENNIKKL